MGDAMFVPSMVNDSVTALDTETGAERWRFLAEGPVRFAPVACKDKVYFVSDDGHLYCLDTNDGSLRWKFRGLPEDRRDRKVVGHGRLISLFPARGGPVLADGVVYFAAGLWPTEGVFIHAVDAESGKAAWSNTEGHHIPKSNWDHGVGQYSGLAPQGYLAIVGDRLVVPCGTQLPAFLDLKTGKVQNYTMGWGGRLGLPKGCWFVAGIGKYLSHAGDLYDITRPSEERLSRTKSGNTDYKPLLYPGGWTRLDIERANQRELDRFSQPVMTPDVMYESDQSIVARDLTTYELRERTKENIPAHRARDEVPDNFGAVFRELWELPSKLDVHIKAGSRLYVGGPGVVEAIDVAGQERKTVWHAEIEGTPTRMLAAADKLFVVTAEGSILAFGAPSAGDVTKHVVAESPLPTVDEWTTKAAEILETTDVRDGYALVLGIDNGRLVEELIRQSDLHVVAVDSDTSEVAALREHLDGAGLYGTRASVLVGDPVTYPFSPYLASLVVSETPDELKQAGQPALVEAVFHALRPYGGIACVWGPSTNGSHIEEIVQDDAFPGASVRQVDDLVLLVRSGPLPGAANWSHAEANAASTGASEDEFIRSPMSVLWFDAADRWHKYPGQNQIRVAGGRLVLHEEGLLRASDVYTGRKMWEVELSDKIIDRQRMHYARHRQWGPSPTVSPATEFVVVDDAIYLGDGSSCRVFDPATGDEVNRIELPEDLARPWSNLRVSDDYLVGNSGPHVLCVQRRTGKLLWRFEAAGPALSLAVGGNKVFCALVADPRRGEDASHEGSMFALDIATGELVWQRAGSDRLRYSPLLDIVVTPTAFYRGSDGEPLPWPSGSSQKRLVVKGKGLPKEGLPGVIAGTKLLTGDEDTLLVYDIASGEQIGGPLQWVRRGCTGTRASTHLLTTRYRANSAWIDLDSREITPLLGVRPGCGVNNNLYPANGVMNIPNLTAGCTCNYAPVSVTCLPAGVVERLAGSSGAGE
jgi:outer membrane protein assembly factor BamB